MKRNLTIILFLFCSCLKVHLNPFDTTTSQGLLLYEIMGSQTRYLAVGANCASWVSPDGVSWDRPPNTAFPGCTFVPGGPSNGSLNGAIYFNGQFIVVGSTSGSGGCGIWTSPDAYTWTQRTCDIIGGTPTALFTLTIVGTEVIAGGSVNSSGDCSFQKSSGDLSKWTQVLHTACGSQSIASMAVSGTTLLSSEFLNVMEPSPPTNLVPNDAIFLSSNSGSTWVAGTAPTNMAFFNIIPGANGRILAFGEVVTRTGGLSFSDTAGSTWNTPATVAVSGATISGGTVLGNTFVGVGGNCDLVMSMDNGQSFQPFTTMGSGCSGVNWSPIVVNPITGVFVAAGNLGTPSTEVFAMSTSGLNGTWTITTLANTNYILGMTVRP
ncbi:hypothetical protein CH373_06595 [Leptospira perolatii]|uniref:Galactose oxidase n=1 Tax=Leptospira perolatii TaxID=2023191 RepID=A0A2M9ZP13_9LEPT|nr:hypothetical protein [Leptospira perolatii]PJZ70610.1 hypothetical protein CH360_03455 [Leptospira perolatii]PJZ73822.1 hypothetical protein CH373_06595 [Leptospira perolatii]